MGRKLWNVKQIDKALAVGLAERNQLFPIAALIASSRGIDSDEKARAFFYDEVEPSSPYDLPDMDKAVQAINRAIDRFDRIAICGDYDADGVTATALLYSYLEEQGADVLYRIPERSEGYGLKKEAIDFFAEQNVKLIVTVDCGISCIEEAEYAKEKGIDLVVTDHHRVGDRIPDCIAVVDPYRADCSLPFKSLAGVGVAFKLVCALEGGDYESVAEQYADLLAMGTVGDVMPLIDENRLFVRRGVHMLNQTDRPGLLALRNCIGYGEKTITSTGLAFTLIPRINAAGRMGSPSRAIKLLLCEEEELAEDLAKEIDHANVLRHKAEAEILKEIKQRLSEQPGLKHDRVIVLDGEGWQHGVIGIVASKIVDAFGRPAIVISRDGETARGSGRSIDGFSLFEAIQSCEDCLIQFGGHTLAAGIGLRSDRIDEFRCRINAYAASCGQMPRPTLNIDCRLNPAVINSDLLTALLSLEPFGSGNPSPIFGLFGMKIDAVQSISDGKHIRLMLSKGTARIGAVRFGVSPDRFPFVKGDAIDCAVAVEPNEYMGEVKPSIQIKAVRANGMKDELVFDGMDLFDAVQRGEKLTPEQIAGALPSREFMLEVYKYIKSQGGWKFDTETLCHRLGDNGENYCKVAVSVEAMTELGTLIQDESGHLLFPEQIKKSDLNSSAILSRIRNGGERA
ncbi:MAG TPA: single-stranded-DNA-specific exonuclease RecJ [Ruminococcaceae bacterium]|nr:single-stranded-DNA-specific exonuclease RecJ [Oscillospiraceae bacterium]